VQYIVLNCRAKLTLEFGEEMERILGRFTPQIFALFRIVFGLLFMMHGTQKLFSWPLPGPPQLPPLLMVAAGLEFVCGLLIFLGLFTSFAAFVASGEMALAYFMQHQPGGLWPIINKGELAVLYCFAFLYIATRGSGIWSVDSRFKGSSRP
jgi:putative oxidoreductase